MDDRLYAYQAPGDAGSGQGPLAECRIAIQPNVSVRQWPTEAGSPALEKYVAVEDAAAVERLRDAGAALVGSIRMSELGFGLQGDAAAEAVRRHTCDAILVNDTMGEARVSAAAAGVFGFKPSYGIVSRLGLIGLVPSMECLSVMAHSPGEAGRIMAAISGPDRRDYSMLTEGCPDFPSADTNPAKVESLGVIRESNRLLEETEVKAFQAALSRLRDTGVAIREVSLPDFDLFRSVHQVVGSVEASSSAGKYDGVRYGHRAAGTENWNEMYLRSRAESFGTLMKSYLFQGAYFQFQNYAAFEDACRIRRRLVTQTTKLFDSVDLLVLPTRRAGFDPSAVGTVSDVYDAFALTIPANVTGGPAASLPGWIVAGAADLGLQLVGRHLDDARLLGFAARLVEARKGA